MLFNSNNNTPTPGACTSSSNTLEPTNTSSQQHDLQQSTSSLLSTAQTDYKQFMGCISTLYSRSSPRAHSILDSPTLVRVERARLRLEAFNQQQNLNSSSSSITNNFKGEDSLEKIMLDPNKKSLLTGRAPVSSMTGPIKRGLLWQQRDRLFSRWKERYFVLTRDYFHCFKRASGSANERPSDMGQFIFKVKLVDVEKVEWLNRRSYSAIGLLLGREGRILLRCDEGLEDWFELLEECTLTSKERRKALKIAQDPRSRASLAVPVSHSSLQSNRFGLCGTYSSTLDDWLMTTGTSMGGVRSQKLVTNSMCYEGTNPFLYSDSVPDLSVINNENHDHLRGLSTNHSTPQKVSCSASNDSSRYSNSYTSQNNYFSNCNGLYGSPRRILINTSLGSTQIVDEETEDGEVELRRPRIFRNLNTENGNELDRDWLYRKPKAPTDIRHSVQPIMTNHINASSNKIVSDFDCSARDSGLDTPPSTHRPSSYREQPRNTKNFVASTRDSAETFASPGDSFRAKQVENPEHFTSNLNEDNVLLGSCHSVQECVLKTRNKEFRTAIKSSNLLNLNEHYDSNQNRYFKNDTQLAKTVRPEQNPIKMYHTNTHNHQVQNQFQPENGNDNESANNNNNASYGNIQNGSVIFRERYQQHPALTAIINEAQGIKIRGTLKNKLSALW